MEEDKDGTYLLNARDLCMIEHIPELISAGVTSFKIEGRAKSAYYTALSRTHTAARSMAIFARRIKQDTARSLGF